MSTWPPLSDFPRISPDIVSSYAELFSKLAHRFFPTWTSDVAHLDPVFIGRNAWYLAHHIEGSKKPIITTYEEIPTPKNTDNMNEGMMIAASLTFFNGVRVSQEAFIRKGM